MKPFATVDIANIVDWIKAIPFSAWPQQTKKRGERPAMVTDLAWRGFGAQAMPIIHALGFDETRVFAPMLSVVMPGHSIHAHRDEQAEYWQTRVHVPLLSNDKAEFVVEGNPFVLLPGWAYQVDTRAEHAIHNRGNTPRVHFLFDVR